MESAHITPEARKAVEALLYDGPVERTEQAAGERAVRMLLDGLGVGSMQELHGLVQKGRPTAEMRYMADRGGDYSAAIGRARLALRNDNPELAARYLDDAVDESHRKHFDACLDDGHSLELVERFLGTRPKDRSERDRSERSTSCPTCGSHAPHLHPAVQHEGEVQPCSDAFHLTVTPENTPERIAETQNVLNRIVFVDAATAESARLLDDAYRQGFLDGVTAYAYSSSEAWAESGVKYVGSTGRTLIEARARVEETHNYFPPSRR